MVMITEMFFVLETTTTPTPKHEVFLSNGKEKWSESKVGCFSI